MTRFLFVSLPLAGHIDWGGMLATASELTRRPEHAVAWASGPAIAPAIAAVIADAARRLAAWECHDDVSGSRRPAQDTR